MTEWTPPEPGGQAQPPHVSNRAFGEYRVAASVTSPRASADEVVDIARRIWREVKAAPARSDADADALLARLQAENGDFVRSFPIVLRWMVQARQFSAKAFRAFVVRCATAQLKSRAEFLELQADYLGALFARRHPHNPAAARQFRDEMARRLTAEDDEFRAAVAAAEREVAAEKAAAAVANQGGAVDDPAADAARRRRLVELLRARV